MSDVIDRPIMQQEIAAKSRLRIIDSTCIRAFMRIATCTSS